MLGGPRNANAEAFGVDVGPSSSQNYLRLDTDQYIAHLMKSPQDHC